MLGEKFDYPADAHLFVFREGFEPAAEFVGALNLPSHIRLCH
jgi:hypothetical protein